MDIDLSKVLAFSKDSLQSRAQLRSIILDLYPHKTLEMNILLAVYESGIPREIKLKNSIDNTIYNRSINKIVNEYGLQEKHAIEGLNTWLEQIFGRDFIAKYGLNVNTSYNQINNTTLITNINNVQPQPITHVPVITHQPVIGNTSDYELTFIDNDKVEIKKFLGFDEEVTTVPNVIKGKKVIGIGKEAYKKCSKIKKLIISKNIEYIGKYSFEECSNLEKIIILEGVKNINDNSFENCFNLKNITLPTSIRRICKNVFLDCRNIEDLILTEGLESIGERAFERCVKLKNISFPTTLKNLGNRAFALTSINQLNLPNKLRIIPNECFILCKSLKKIQFPDSLEEISSYAFSDCKSLINIKLPNNLKRICSSAFDLCINLFKIEMNEGLIELESGVFAGCINLKEITIPSTVKNISDDLFIRNGYNTNKSITIYAYPGSPAIEFARKNNLPLKRAV